MHRRKMIQHFVFENKRAIAMCDVFYFFFFFFSKEPIASIFPIFHRMHEADHFAEYPHDDESNKLINIRNNKELFRELISQKQRIEK